MAEEAVDFLDQFETFFEKDDSGYVEQIKYGENIFSIKEWLSTKILKRDKIIMETAIGFAVDRILVDRNIHADKVKRDILEEFKKRGKE